MSTFQRARTQQQRDKRREHILAVARELLADRRVADLGLNELARQVGLAKSNVLRYFDSREAVLLELTRREYTAWLDDLAEITPATIAEVARLIATTAVARPLLADLLSSLMTTLEHNVTTETIIEFKLAMRDQIGRLQRLLETTLGELPETHQGAMIPGIHGLIVEFHSLAHPATALKEAAARDPRIHCGLEDHADALAAALTIFFTGARATS